MSLLNKVALVTGASSGIGAAVALKFSAEGAKVALVCKNEDKLKVIAKKCEEAGSKPLIIFADLTEDENAIKIVNNTLNHFGKLDVLVNNAGVGIAGSIFAQNIITLYDKMMAINLRAVVNLTNIAGPHLIESKGNIVNVSSVSATKALIPSGCTYNASKAALEQFSKTIAIELGAKGVRVNCVNPGPVRTSLLVNVGFTEAQQYKFFENAKKVTALNKISEPEEIADLILFLASDKAKSITGSSFAIDNGVNVK